VGGGGPGAGNGGIGLPKAVGPARSFRVGGGGIPTGGGLGQCLSWAYHFRPGPPGGVGCGPRRSVDPCGIKTGTTGGESPTRGGPPHPSSPGAFLRGPCRYFWVLYSAILLPKRSKKGGRFKLLKLYPKRARGAHSGNQENPWAKKGFPFSGDEKKGRLKGPIRGNFYFGRVVLSLG